MGEVFAEAIDCEAFHADRLEDALGDIREMTLQRPKDFQSALRELLATCGVALVIVPHFSGTKAHGATFWLSEDKAVLMLTIRGRWADIFWFSLFHELGHVLLHRGRRETIIENGAFTAEQQAREDEVDAFARDVLIPASDYRRFVAASDFYPQAVERFAREIGVDAGILVGRLQHDGHLRPEWGNKLRTKYDWAKPKAQG
jgi:HTH-type transcriptional regulator/antitoxin HigA